MCSFFPKDEPSTVRNALTELKDEKYVIIIHGNTYAVNKLRMEVQAEFIILHYQLRYNL
ncbi:MAG: hypothetical protein K6B38_11215 [Ruminococcus sp.]|nr:hypothetical protein [Ruminococcus sp.]